MAPASWVLGGGCEEREGYPQEQQYGTSQIKGHIFCIHHFTASTCALFFPLVLQKQWCYSYSSAQPWEVKIKKAAALWHFMLYALSLLLTSLALFQRFVCKCWALTHIQDLCSRFFFWHSIPRPRNDCCGWFKIILLSMLIKIFHLPFTSFSLYHL